MCGCLITCERELVIADSFIHATLTVSLVKRLCIFCYHDGYVMMSVRRHYVCPCCPSGWAKWMVFQVLEALCANPWCAHSFRVVILEDHVLHDVRGVTVAREVTLYEDFSG